MSVSESLESRKVHFVKKCVNFVITLSILQPLELPKMLPTLQKITLSDFKKAIKILFRKVSELLEGTCMEYVL